MKNKNEKPPLESKCGSYKITCNANKRAYYGMSINVDARDVSCMNQLRSGSHHCVDMQSDFSKFGEEKFKFEVLERTPDYVSASLSEISHLVKAIGKKENVYNVIGKNVRGDKHISTIITTSIAFKKANIDALKETAESGNQSVSWIVNRLVEMLLSGRVDLR